MYSAALLNFFIHFRKRTEKGEGKGTRVWEGVLLGIRRKTSLLRKTRKEWRWEGSIFNTPLTQPTCHQSLEILRICYPLHYSVIYFVPFNLLNIFKFYLLYSLFSLQKI